MFPTFVWKAELRPEVAEPLNREILAALAGIGAPLATLQPGESWQSEHDLHRRETFRCIVAAIMDGAVQVLDALKADREAALTLTGCWANANAPGARHGLHTHPNNYLSGVYYVRAGAGADTINFHDPRPQTAVIRPSVHELTADNADQVVVTVEAGTLLLFPAWLPHSVDPNRSGKIRLSLGFNLMFAAYAETLGRPSWEPGLRAPG
jgi:uncharacterized protein (TIGR02466 family)